jgi:hypothetical protein
VWCVTPLVRVLSINHMVHWSSQHVTMWLQSLAFRNRRNDRRSPPVALVVERKGRVGEWMCSHCANSNVARDVSVSNVLRTEPRASSVMSFSSSLSLSSFEDMSARDCAGSAPKPGSPHVVPSLPSLAASDPRIASPGHSPRTRPARARHVALATFGARATSAPPAADFEQSPIVVRK